MKAIRKKYPIETQCNKQKDRWTIVLIMAMTTQRENENTNVERNSKKLQLTKKNKLWNVKQYKEI